MQTLRKIYMVLSISDKRTIIALFIGVLITGLFEVAGIASIGPFMGVVTSPNLIHDNQYLDFAYKYLEFNNDSEFLIALGSAVVLLLVITNIFLAFMVWRLTLFVNLLSHRLSVKLLKIYLNKSYQFFLEHNTTELGKNVLFEISRGVQGAILPALLALSRVFIIILVVSLLMIINPKLVIIAILILVSAYLLIYKSLSSSLLKAGNLSVSSTRDKYKFVTEALSGIKEVKLYNKQNNFVDQYSKESEVFARCNTSSSIISQIPRYFVEAVAFSGIIFLIIFLTQKGKNSSEVIPMVSVFALAAYRLVPALQQVYHSISQIKYNLPILEILGNDLSNEVISPNSTLQNSEAILHNNQLDLISVSFKYENSNKLILNNVSLSIKQNTTVGIVGLTGSGKTTLINLIMGLIEATNGHMALGGRVLDETNMSSWQKNIGYVPQDIFLIDDTIKNNIIFAGFSGDTDADFINVVDSAKIAGISDFIDSLPDSYDTMVGERGVRLSGGQIQRIGIARALYRLPTVIIFDEATSSLDGITEKILMETIQKIAHKKTVIMVAHRLSSVKRCDVIHLIENGVIAESGSYEELITQDLSFKKMVDSYK
jgi:ATP-binding cassette, subfamily B, bacterial PglK